MQVRNTQTVRVVGGLPCLFMSVVCTVSDSSSVIGLPSLASRICKIEFSV